MNYLTRKNEYIDSMRANMEIWDKINPETRMMIEDQIEFIEGHDFRQYSIRDVEKTAGRAMTKRMKDYLGDDFELFLWYFSPEPEFNGEIPNDVIKTKEGRERINDKFTRSEEGLI